MTNIPMIKYVPLLLGLTLPAAGFAQNATTAAVEEVPQFTFGGDLRLRNEYLNNALTLNDDTVRHDQDYYRIRARLWASYKLVPALELNARITAEPRVWMHPSFVKQHPGSGTEMRYAIVDNLNAKLTKELDDSWGVSCTAGRQDIQLGDVGKWWLVADGSPGDGSWTSYFDAMRFTLENKEKQMKFDLIALEERAMPDSNFPILGARSTYSMAEQNEKGLIFHASAELLPGVQWNGFAIYKNDSKALSNGDNADIYTLGMGLSGTPGEHWTYDFEVAGQWGQKEDATLKWSNVGSGERDIRAWGVNGNTTYLFKDSMSNKLGLEFEYLSGDDPDTEEDEMFDILWGRYPRWSDAYAFAYAPETSGKLGQMNNIVRIGPTWSIAPTKKLGISAAYAVLLAPESTPTRATNATLFSNDGHTRGQLWQLIAKQQFTKHVSGLICAEVLTQGDFYANRDTISFVRVELLTKF